MFFIIHVVSDFDWNQNDAVTLFLFFFSFLFSLFNFFSFYSTTFRWLCWVFVAIWLIKFLLPFPHILLNCLYMHIGSSKINVHCQLSSVPCVFLISHLFSRLNTLRTGDADLRFYITTVQDGWRKSAFLTRGCFPCTIHLIMQYIEPVSEWSCWRRFIETWPHSELTFRHRASSI